MKLFPKAFYIHIVRDPRDRAVSFQHHVEKFGPSEKVERIDWSENVIKSATEWAAIVRTVRTNVAQNRVRYHELRYEDLLDRPHETLVKVFDFLDVDTAPVASCIEAASFEKLSGGRRARPRGSGLILPQGHQR